MELVLTLERSCSHVWVFTLPVRRRSFSTVAANCMVVRINIAMTLLFSINMTIKRLITIVRQSRNLWINTVLGWSAVLACTVVFGLWYGGTVGKQAKAFRLASCRSKVV